MNEEVMLHLSFQYSWYDGSLLKNVDLSPVLLLRVLLESTGVLASTEAIANIGTKSVKIQLHLLLIYFIGKVGD